jgi:hypothetical protein
MARPEVTGRKVRPSIVTEGMQFYDQDLKVVLLPFVLDTKQAAKFICCSPSQLYVMLVEKSEVRKEKNLPFIPSHRIGAKRLIRRDVLEKLFDEPTPLQSLLEHPGFKPGKRVEVAEVDA